jgi:hypothetical protein
MKIDERIWPLPNAFNIREGSPFGRSEAVTKALKRSAESSKKGIKVAANREAKKNGTQAPN